MMPILAFGASFPKWPPRIVYGISCCQHIGHRLSLDDSTHLAIERSISQAKQCGDTGQSLTARGDRGPRAGYILAGHITLYVFGGFVTMLGAVGILGWLGAVIPLAMTVALMALNRRVRREATADCTAT